MRDRDIDIEEVSERENRQRIALWLGTCQNYEFGRNDSKLARMTQNLAQGEISVFLIPVSTPIRDILSVSAETEWNQ